MTLNKTILIASLLVAATGMASDSIVSGGPGTNLKWEDFKYACKNPAQFGNQIPQQDIKVTCKGERMVWEAGKGVMLLQDTFKIEGQATSSKYSVDADFFDKSPAARLRACTRYQQVKETIVANEKKVTCAQIKDFKGDLGDFCVGILKAEEGCTGSCPSDDEEQQQQQTQVRRAMPANSQKASALSVVKREPLGVFVPDSCKKLAE